MKLNSHRLNLDYQHGEAIFTFAEEIGLPFIFDCHLFLMYMKS